MDRDLGTLILKFLNVLLVLALAAGAATGKQPKTEGRASGLVWEKLDRGLVARRTRDGRVYLGWRLLRSDPHDAAFNVYRRSGDGPPQKLTEQPLRQTTDFVDLAPADGAEAVYSLRAVISGKEGRTSKEIAVDPSGKANPYAVIKLSGDHTFQKVGIADLNGDGRYDFVIKQPNANIDPYEKYWKPSPETYQLEAYLHDGTFLWRYDLGWAIERGIWYSPYVVYDLNGDGKAEVALKTGEGDPRDADGRVQSGPEYLTVLDGLTGRPITHIAWPSRALFADTRQPYNNASRNQLGVAYLDGKNPSLIVERGTCNVIVVVAYRFFNGRLQELWRWDNRNKPSKYWGQGAHWMHAADVDRDGRQEIVLGSAVIDDNGTALWSTGLGHTDHCYVGDIDPDRTGLEIYYGIETRQRERNGMCLVDAATGQILWGHEGHTRHVHGQGMCSDIDARHRGAECYSADTDAAKRFAWARLRNCKGEVLSDENLGGFGPQCVYWDADPQRELLRSGRIVKYRGAELAPQVEGHVAAVADILGDWREEVIASTPGELRIYTTTIPSSERHVCLMQDPLYRMNVVTAAMGYFQVPMTSYGLAQSAKK